jgi:PAS domain S-box-containing protein
VAGFAGVGGNVEDALERISVPSYVIDRTGVIRWVNPAARAIVGDVRGLPFTKVVAHEDSRRARETFARNLAGKERVADASVVLVAPNGNRVQVEVSSVRLVDHHHVVGVFGQLVARPDDPPPPPHPHLTPRQAEVLRLLEHGRSTAQISSELHLRPETVRNHVRHILRALGVHSRLEAVAVARRTALA